MSSTSILQFKKCKISSDIDEVLKVEARKFLLFSKYMVGKSADFKKVKKLKRVERILNYDKCILDLTDEDLKCIINRELI